MEKMGPEKGIGERLSTFKYKLRIGRAVLLAVLKGGIPRRFWFFFFVIGLAIGVGAKTVAKENFVIGYGDYRLSKAEALYDLNAVERTLIQADEFEEESETEEKMYPACTLND